MEGGEVNQDHSQAKIIGIDTPKQHPKVLVVDDIGENCRLLEYMLTPMGFQVQIANNGQEALNIWSNWHPDLILMDLQMPVMDGYQAISSIRSQEKNTNCYTKIIAVTASIFDKESYLLTEIGGDDLVRKPFTESELLAKIRAHLQLNYIYEEIDAEAINTSYIVNTFDQDNMKASLQEMPVEWLQLVVNAANKGSDDELLILIEQIPDHLSELVQWLTNLTNEFQFSEIVRLISEIK